MGIDFRFYAITDRKKIPSDLFFTYVEKALAQGIRAIQIREKDLPSLELYRLCKEAKDIADRFGAKVFVNDRCDIALSLNLDGVHLAESSLPTDQARKILGNHKLIGVSAHSMAGVIKAQTLGANFVVLGPVSQTPSKLPGHAIMTVEEFQTCCEQSSIPIFALGGVDLDNAGIWLKHGAYGLAGISLWMNQGDNVDWSRLKSILGGF
jgi:thiamine-phosphate pyrophosphorylase